MSLHALSALYRPMALALLGILISLLVWTHLPPPARLWVWLWLPEMNQEDLKLYLFLLHGGAGLVLVLLLVAVSNLIYLLPKINRLLNERLQATPITPFRPGTRSKDKDKAVAEVVDRE
jgi:hypothetical protein